MWQEKLQNWINTWHQEGCCLINSAKQNLLFTYASKKGKIQISSSQHSRRKYAKIQIEKFEISEIVKLDFQARILKIDDC